MSIFSISRSSKIGQKRRLRTGTNLGAPPEGAACSVVCHGPKNNVNWYLRAKNHRNFSNSEARSTFREKAMSVPSIIIKGHPQKHSTFCSRLWSKLLIVCFLLYAERSNAEPIASDTEDAGLAVCTGYDPVRNRWGPWGEQLNDKGEDNCPAGQAFMAHTFVAGNRWNPISTFSISGYCCKVPNGVLLDEHIFAPEQCPDDFVVTGSRVEKLPKELGDGTHQSEKHLFRCTRIDRTKFTLGPPTPGWEVGLPRDSFDQLPKRLIYGVRERLTTRSRIPVALRYGLFRIGPSTWDADGCIGHPWGSILTERINKACDGHIFRQILYLHAASRKFAPVKMYPDCIALSSPFDPNAVCIRTR